MTPPKPDPATLALLAGAADVADHCGVPYNTIHHWRRTAAERAYTFRGRPVVRIPFPDPAVVFGQTPVWWLPDVDAWMVATGRTVLDAEEWATAEVVHRP